MIETDLHRLRTATADAKTFRIKPTKEKHRNIP